MLHKNAATTQRLPNLTRFLFSQPPSTPSRPSSTPLLPHHHPRLISPPFLTMAAYAHPRDRDDGMSSRSRYPDPRDDRRDEDRRRDVDRRERGGRSHPYQRYESHRRYDSYKPGDSSSELPPRESRERERERDRERESRSRSVNPTRSSSNKD
jgi:hypothetical protein